MSRLPDHADPALDRRTVLKSIGAMLAVASAAGCDGAPDEHALPYVSTPEFLVPGKPRHYATAALFAGVAQPVIGTTHDGRPTKLEGNPDHPASGGATDAVTQAALMGLYDPARSRAPRYRGSPASWPAFETVMVELAARLDGTQGEGFRLLTGALTSPTLLGQIGGMLRRWPMAGWHVWEPAGDENALAATTLAFGRRLGARYDLSAADVVVSLDDDLLGAGPRQTLNAGQWAQRRRAFQEGRSPSRMFVAEPTPTLTGAMADRRLAAPASDMPALLQALASALGLQGIPAPILAEPETAWIAAAAAALARAGPRSLLRVGSQHDPAVQALAILVNERLGNRGTTQWFTEPDTGELEPLTLAELVSDATAGALSALVVLGGNPVHTAAGDLPVGEAFDAVPLRVHAGLYDDETAALCHWHAPVTHDLESWSDARAADGSVVLLQPLVRPFLSVRSPHVLLDTIQGRLDRSDRDIVQDSWRGRWGNRYEENWARSLHRGIVAGSIPPPADLDDGAIAVPQRLPEPAEDAGGIELIIRPDPCIWDGRFAANPWLQELPRPLTKLTWDAPVLLSPDLAADLGVADEDLVSVTIDGGTVVGPALAMPGQATRTVALFRGYGRSRGAGPAIGIGYNAAVLDRSGRPHRGNAAVAATGDAVTLAITQRHDSMEGQPLVRTVAAADADARGEEGREGPPPSFHPPRTAGSPSWGMSIDLDLCIGCNACVAACVAENNIAMVGAEQVAMGREMHWLRVDRYRDEDGATHFQPVPCMHCEQAPCEMGCPVNATVHSGDGLNLQVYNRCIGTRTCSSYCPYKVRRFNWFDLTGDDPEPVQAARNPDVTVRGRGVMEKCTYCIQRISAARIAAKLDDRPIGDGEVRTACQQACPTRAIVFGDITDPDSAVSRRKAQPRDYALLEEVNTRPRTTYLARIRAPGNDGGDGEDAD